MDTIQIVHVHGYSLIIDQYYEIPVDIEVVYELVERIYNSRVHKYVPESFTDIWENDARMMGVELVKKERHEIGK